MDISYVYNEKMRESYMLQAVFNKMCVIEVLSLIVKSISVYFRKNNLLKNNMILLLYKHRKVMAFE
ncbi:hypothetical protein [Clostridium lacusfryxellense]|uniref:hypothetical protein n=1 Tax=Clostridium lacusfryxellense TaxID=205328 RepID=UPI001C0B4DB8|nr:hypothetical protein [Clostridium lacusfryxellense]MBU3111543.1 hypothetical protein [Clostridium lacusfryxellense]